MISTYDFEEGRYYYMVALTVEDSTSTSDADIIGTLTLSKSKMCIRDRCWGYRAGSIRPSPCW